LVCSTLRNSDLSKTFSESFPGISLAELLSNFSLPISLGDLKQLFPEEVGCSEGTAGGGGLILWAE